MPAKDTTRRNRQDQRSNVVKIGALHHWASDQVKAKYPELRTRDLIMLACADTIERGNGDHFSVKGVMRLYGLKWFRGAYEWRDRMVKAGYITSNGKKRAYGESIQHGLTMKAHFALQYYSRVLLQKLASLEDSVIY